jgi:aerobic-type carbon monoxide dehydrogenase small subunit (CoxS/CutS family)
MSAPDPIAIALTLNGRALSASVAPQMLLADLLREQCGLTGTKIGCDQATCGACTVLIDGAPMAACATFAWQADGAAVTTIEGLAANGALDPVQEAFKAKSAFQCGYCTPGMIMAAKALLAHNLSPNRAAIRDWLSANVCRCTGYQMIVEAVEDAARRIGAAKR